MVFKFPFILKFKVRFPGKLQFSVKEHPPFNARGICEVQYMQKNQEGISEKCCETTGYFNYLKNNGLPLYWGCLLMLVSDR